MMSIKGISKYGGKRRKLILDTCEESQKKKMTKWSEAEEMLLVQAMEKHSLGKNNKPIRKRGYALLAKALDGDFTQTQIQSKVYFLRKDGDSGYNRLKAIIKGKGGLSEEGKSPASWSKEDELLLIKTIDERGYTKPISEKHYRLLRAELGNKFTVTEIQGKLYSIRTRRRRAKDRLEEKLEEQAEIPQIPQSKTITFNNFRIRIGLDGIRLDGEVSVE